MFKKKTRSTIVVNFDAGFQNTLYVRGKGIPGLNWEKGVPLRNTKRDEWILEIDSSFKNAEFKVLINDKVYELGENHRIAEGSNVRLTPKF